MVGAKAAFQRAVASCHTDASPMAAVSLGDLLKQEGDVAGARWAFQWTIDSGHVKAAPGASSPMRQGVTDTRRSLRILADYPSETAQVTGTERLTWPSAARRSRRLRFCQVPIGVRPADTIPAVP